MITHVVVFRWKPEVPEGHAAAVAAALRTLPARIDTIRDYRVGEDAGLADGNHDVALVATFDDPQGWQVYQADAEHQRIRTELILPWVAERAAIQFES